MAEWGTLRLVRTTVSYLVSPAFLASDLIFQIVEYAIPIPSKPQARLENPGPPRIVSSRFDDRIPKAVELTEDQSDDLRSTLDGSESVVAPIEVSSPTGPPQNSPDSAEETRQDEKESQVLPLSVHFAEESTPLSTIPIQSILSIFNRRATACISSFELADLSNYGTAIAEEPLGYHTREPTRQEIEFVEERLRAEVEFVEKVIEEAVEKRRVASITAEASDEGKTYFDGMKMSFVTVEIHDTGIDTVQFLEAVESLLEMFEQFASSAFALVQMDINENIRRIRVRHDVAPTKSRTLEALVRNERPERRRLATEALLWLFRGLKFVHDSLDRNLRIESEGLMDSFTVVWEAEYSRYYSWIVRPLFKLLIKACPTREVFYTTLGSSRVDVERDMRSWLEAMGSQVRQLEEFYRKEKLG